jgi:hypothetical protein
MSDGTNTNRVIEYLSNAVISLHGRATVEDVFIALSYLTACAALSIFNDDTERTSEFLQKAFTSDKLQNIIIEKNQFGTGVH